MVPLQVKVMVVEGKSLAVTLAWAGGENGADVVRSGVLAMELGRVPAGASMGQNGTPFHAVSAPCPRRPRRIHLISVSSYA